MNTTTEDKTLSTADFAAAADRRDVQRDRREGDDAPTRAETMQPDAARPGHRRAEGRNTEPIAGSEQLAPLFLPQMAQEFRARWDEVQIGFVNDPTQAVRRADELVAQVMKDLAGTFARERENLEGQLSEHDTEHLRVALRRYRSFFQRLLSL